MKINVSVLVSQFIKGTFFGQLHITQTFKSLFLFCSQAINILPIRSILVISVLTFVANFLQSVSKPTVLRPRRAEFAMTAQYIMNPKSMPRERNFFNSIQNLPNLIQIVIILLLEHLNELSIETSTRVIKGEIVMGRDISAVFVEDCVV